MAGVKGRSGPPGNLNSAKRPWRTFARRGALRAADKWVQRPADLYLAGLQADDPDASNAKQQAQRIARDAHACGLLVLNDLQTATDPEQRRRWLAEYRAFAALELKALATIGLDRHERRVGDLSLAQYLAAVGQAPATVIPVHNHEEPDHE